MIAQDPNLGQEVAPIDPTAEVVIDEQSASMLAARAGIKAWQQKILAAKMKFKDDFDNMRENMNFVAGYQWKNQKKIDDDRYITNFLLRLIKHKVATLYAKDPKTEWVRRKRLDYLAWDGKLDSLMLAVQTAQQTVAMGGMIDPHTALVLQDYMEGKQWEQLVEKVGETLKIAYQYQIDTQEPEFKTQFKDLVDRTCVCGVGYVRANLCVSGEQQDLTQSATKSPEINRIKRAKQLVEDLTNGKIEPSSAQMETLKSLLSGLGVNLPEGGFGDNEYDVNLQESIVFDFPQSTSVIPDPRCKRLKGFIGARWLAIEYKLNLSEVNALYGTDIKVGGDLKTFRNTNDQEEAEPNTGDPENATNPDATDPVVCLWEVFDITTKTKFIICDGYKDYVSMPEPHQGINRAFWPVFALTFNSVESEPGCRSTIFPPSDIQLGKSQQKEWNRSRNALRGQRQANRPRYMFADGQMTPDDAKRIATAQDNEVFPLKLQAGQKLSDVFGAVQPAPIDPNVYDTSNVKEDLLLATGAQEANLGPAQSNVTATNSTIAEQSRTLVASSNADDIDDLLNSLAEYVGGLMLAKFSRDTIVAIVGRGATWPQTPQTRNLFQREVLLSSVSSSTGRPNKALNINNFERIAPLLQAAGANPFAIIEEALKVYDANLEAEDFFPLPQPPPGDQQSLDGGQTPGEGETQPQSTAQTTSPLASRGMGQTMPVGVQPMQTEQQTAVAV